MIAKFLILMISGYQRFISPLFGARCRFYPTCSEYAMQALKKHGACRGAMLSAWRLLKCGPWHPGGIDQVP
ncbi:MAG TPA: membrane protein insertion efficiency factor YidD [Bacteroidetes bacterium]|nr:membrane protein insertion efficiency factor YidD [Bacteroidota bacterium]